MNIVLGIATVVMMGVVIYLNVRLNNHEADTNLEIESLKTKYGYIEKLDESIDSDLDSAEMHINEITARLEEIAKDIKRLDERTDADHKNLVDIRRRYVLFREQPHPNGGVQWSETVKVTEDNDE